MRAIGGARARRRTVVTAALLAAPLLAAGLVAAPAAAQVRVPVAAVSATPAQSFIVRAVPGSLPAVMARVAERGRVTGQLPLINAVVGQLSPDAVRGLRGDSRVAEITANAGVQLLGFDPSTDDPSGVGGDGRPLAADYDPATDGNSMFNMERQIGIRNLWTEKITGTGIDVALLDSGVTPVEGLNAPGKVVNGPDLTPESQDKNTRYLDTFGHGTHMAGIIAGRDTGADPAASVNNPGPFLGVAPGARVVSVKVADAHGATDVSQVIAGIGWVVQHARDPGLNIRVLNLSFGTDSAQSYLYDPLAYAAEIAWRKGIVVVVAAGNSGAKSGRLTNPALDPYLLAVGAGDTRGTQAPADDTVADFSSRGTTTRTPDIVAPGSHLQSLRVPGSYIDQSFGVTGAVNHPRYFRGSGSSQAAAVTSGAAALLLQARPSLKPDQVKYILKMGSRGLGLDRRAQGNGMLNGGTVLTYKSGTVAQNFAKSTGSGTLEGARGTSHLQLDGVELRGEKDIFGKPFNSAQMAAQLAAGTSWSGGTWNGSLWAGGTMSDSGVAGGTTSDSGAAGTAWTGRNWAGGFWTGRNWAEGYWNGRNWAGTNWTSGSWDGFGWTGRNWGGAGWSSSTWR